MVYISQTFFTARGTIRNTYKASNKKAL